MVVSNYIYIGVAYKEDTDQVVEVIRNVGNALIKDDILEPIEIIGLANFGDRAIVIKTRIKTKMGSMDDVA